MIEDFYKYYSLSIFLYAHVTIFYEQYIFSVDKQVYLIQIKFVYLFIMQCQDRNGTST